MTVEYFWAIVVSLWGLVIPGLPIVLFLKKQFFPTVDVAVASPFVSLGVTYVTVGAFNFIGFHLPLWLMACGFLALSVVLLLLSSSMDSILRKVNLNTIVVVCSTSLLTIYVWTTAYAGYLFVAPNTDGRHHNFYVARIMESGSALPRDVLVPSPLSPMGIANDFYPLAWHTSVAVPASLFQVSAASATMVSAIVFWAVVMPVGIIRLSTLLRERAQFLGPIAALLSQVIPLVPGVPMTWGAFPSIVGIALLPGALYLVILVSREISSRTALLALFVIFVLILVHPPEAFSVLLLVPAVLIVVLYQRPARRTFFFLGAVVALLTLIMVIQWDLISRKFSGLTENAGAVSTFDRLLSSFFQMNINTGFEQVAFAVFLIGGLMLGGQSLKWNWVGLVLFLFLVVYLISGTAGQPWESLRFIATPWYTSYERTLWVTVPIAVIFVANCFEAVLSKIQTSNWKFSILLVPITIFLTASVVSSLVPATISILRKGPFENEIVAKEDFGVFKRASLLQGETGIIYSEVNQGSIYAFIYEDVRVTNGNYGRSGLVSENVMKINTGIRSICDDVEAQDAFVREDIRGAVLSTRNAAWEVPVWTREEIRKLQGFDLLAEGKYSYLLVPNFKNCPK